MSIRTAISNAMDLAQLMSLPSAFQPGMRNQANHTSLNMMPIPQLVEASTHRSGSSVWHGLRERERPGLSRTASHQRKLSRTDLGAWRVAKSLGNLEMNDTNGGNVEW